MAVHFWPADQKAPAKAGFDSAVEVGIGHDDQRVLAAQLELHAFARASRLVAHHEPVSTEPVNESARTRAWCTSAAPIIEPRR